MLENPAIRENVPLIHSLIGVLLPHNCRRDWERLLSRLRGQAELCVGLGKVPTSDSVMVRRAMNIMGITECKDRAWTSKEALGLTKARFV